MGMESHMDIIIVGISILLLIILSGFFSGSETSLTASSSSRIHKLALEGNLRAKLVKRLNAKAENLIGAILLGNNLVNILASALATALFIKLFGDIGVVYATVTMTFLILIFAEILPKTYAITHPEKMALWVAPMIRLVVIVFFPVVRLVQVFVRLSFKLLRIDIVANPMELSARDELRGAISLQAHEGGLIKNHKDMLDSILDLEEVQLEDIIIHRKSVEMINSDDTQEAIFNQVVASPYTRLPLWKDDPDNIIGVLHAKDVLRAVKANGGTITGLDFKSIALEPWFVPETTSLQEQLNAFLERKAHFALVVDEYGAFMGVMTLEDILEEIVGEISDEHDRSSLDVTVLKGGSVITAGITPIRDLNRQFNWTISDEEATTIAGHVISLAEAIPLPGQTFEQDGFSFEVLKRRRNQITSISINPAKRTP